MSHHLPEIPESFQEIYKLRCMFEQEKLFDLFTKARSRLAEFLETLSAARVAYLKGARDIEIDADSFRELVKLYEDAFLVIIPEVLHESLRSKAEQSVSDFASALPLGIVKPIAIAELSLRTLMIFILELLSNQYNGEVRIPDWNRAIKDEKAELETTRQAWRDACAA